MIKLWRLNYNGKNIKENNSPFLNITKIKCDNVSDVYLYYIYSVQLKQFINQILTIHLQIILFYLV